MIAETVDTVTLMDTIQEAMNVNTARKQSCPFSTRILEEECDPQHFTSLLPVFFHTNGDLPISPTIADAVCVIRELRLDRLHRIHSLLWVAGQPMPPHPLHQQLLQDHEICISERMDLHLILTKKLIYMKPIPRFLLEPHFWYEYLSCEATCNCASTTTTNTIPKGTSSDQAPPCERHQLRKIALGFLFSYCSLIRHESDLALAKDKYLVPREVEWSSWRLLVQEILATESLYENMDRRFFYGELRLPRLNLIYFYSHGLRGWAGYMPQWTSSRDFVGDNFRWVATAVVYMAFVLTAMQVGLSTTWLAGSEAFHRASYGTLFLIFARDVADARDSFYSMILRQRRVALEAV
ncbi:hypothetical protein J1614_005489 [Plenodomus biglobosus]|nr:hypothetical protein J1614_005489 [Plenodomus biglobosus]